MTRRERTFRRVWCGLVLVAVSTLASCPPPGSTRDDDDADDESASTDDFAYVLQLDAVTVPALADAAFGWLVLEPSRDGKATGDLSATEIQQIRDGGPCRKTLLAYLSIGEAEDYRDYWDPAWVDAAGDPRPGVAPSWLGPTNPDWPGNYKVRYWDAGWPMLLFGTPDGVGRTPLDRILDQGFDGVYLDIVDAYEFWSSADGGTELTRAEARGRMIDLIVAIATYARQTRGHADFFVFPQNAADIIRNDNDEFDGYTEQYFTVISGIGQEDLFYDELTPQPAVEVEHVLAQLRQFRSQGKTVLVTDYIIRPEAPGPADNDARVADFYARCRAEGFVPYAACRDRALNALVTFDGTGWTYAQPAPGCAANDDASPTTTD